jgi:hypothetical protein
LSHGKMGFNWFADDGTGMILFLHGTDGKGEVGVIFYWKITEQVTSRVDFEGFL